MQRLAETYFDPEFLTQIEQHCLASGKLGGKTLGLLLAWRILSRDLPADVLKSIHIPKSYFVGADEFARFAARYEDGSGFAGNSDRYEDFLAAPLSVELSNNLRMMLEKEDGLPLIARSSSVLEDQYGSAFAGIYKTVFCPSQGTISKRLQQLEQAIKEVYYSAFSADAISYRKKRGLSEFPEEMAVLIQTVEGNYHKDLYFPDAAGIAFSKNPYCWTDRLNPDDGFIRLVWGLGSRAVQSQPGDYPRLIGLTNPQLRPETLLEDLYHYSQHFFDVIDLKTGSLETLPVSHYLNDSYDGLRFIASLVAEDGWRDIRTRLQPDDQPVVTFQKLMASTPFIKVIDQCLKTLSASIGDLINIEFSVKLKADATVEIGLLQCRQLGWDSTSSELAIEPADERIILKTNRFLYSGEKLNIEYMICVDPSYYLDHLSQHEQQELVGVINALNEKLEKTGYFLSGPGRWGSTRPELGIPVRFGDIYNAKVLLEIHQASDDLFFSTYGTHFFLDLVEGKIPLLAIDTESAHKFFRSCALKTTKNLIKEFVPNLPIEPDGIQVYRLSGGDELNLAASPEQGNAFVYFSGHR